MRIYLSFRHENEDHVEVGHGPGPVANGTADGAGPGDGGTEPAADPDPVDAAG